MGISPKVNTIVRLEFELTENTLATTSQGLRLNNELMVYIQMVLMSRVFVSGQGVQGSIQGRVIPKTQKNGT